MPSTTHCRPVRGPLVLLVATAPFGLWCCWSIIYGCSLFNPYLAELFILKSLLAAQRSVGWVECDWSPLLLIVRLFVVHSLTLSLFTPIILCPNLFIFTHRFISLYLSMFIDCVHLCPPIAVPSKLPPPPHNTVNIKVHFSKIWSTETKREESNSDWVLLIRLVLLPFFVCCLLASWSIAMNLPVQTCQIIVVVLWSLVLVACSNTEPYPDTLFSEEEDARDGWRFPSRTELLLMESPKLESKYINLLGY